MKRSILLLLMVVSLNLLTAIAPVYAKHNLHTLRTQYPINTQNKIILIDISEQRLYLYRYNLLLQTYPISSARKGVGSRSGTMKTPLGAHRIKGKIGRNVPRGTVFDKLRNTKRIAKIHTRPTAGTALVTTRVLRLDGLEIGKNKGGHVDTYTRYIYIHGTNKEGSLGRPKSHGCIRMNNRDVIKLFNSVANNILVYIQK